MNIWLAVALILAVISIYLFVIEAFSVAFKLTGLATKKIRFQVASLFTSAGFTTAESELITNDDRRRRIATVCMYTGHIFSVLIMGLVINVLFSIGTTNTTVTEQWYFIVFYVSLGLFLLVLFIKIPPINKRFAKFLETIAINSSKRSRNSNIITVVDYYGKHAVAEVILNKIPPFAQELTLLQMELTKKYAINILSIKRGKRIVEVTKDTMFRKSDILIIYGLTSDIQNAFVNSLDEKNKTIVIDRTNELTLLSNYGTNALMEVVVDEVPKELENIKMKDSHLTDRYGINIVVIRRKDEYLSADKETIILEGDRITLFGPYSNIKHLFNNNNK
jgi:Trk K+ transport system NAD-binding subunit